MILAAQILLGYAAFCVLWFGLFSKVLSDGSAGSLGLALVPSIPAILLYVEVREAMREMIYGRK